MSKQEKSEERIPQQDRKLTEKEKRFCEEYVVDLNATQAAIRAKYSEGTAYSIASEKLKKLRIQKYVRLLMEQRRLRTQVTADRVLEDLARIAFVEEGVKTGDKLKALGMLAKHVGLFDKQIRKFSEFLKETKLTQTYQRPFDDEEKPYKAIVQLLKPMDREALINALEEKEELMEEANGAPETVLEPGDDGGEEKNDILSKVMREVLGEERIKCSVLCTIDDCLRPAW